MPKHVQLITLTETEAGQYTGPEGELIVEEGSFRLRVQDGLTAGGVKLLTSTSNLSDLDNIALARTNLGLGSAAQHAAGDFLTAAGNLFGLTDLPTARSNLGLANSAIIATGTSGTHIPLLDGANTWSGDQVISKAQPTFKLADSGSTFTSYIDNLNNVWRFMQRDNTAGTYISSLIFDASGVATFAQPILFAGSGALALAEGGTGSTTAAGARTNLGLGSSATHAITDMLQPSLNLSDLASATTARTNLGLGSAAVQNTTAFDAAGAAATAQANAQGSSLQKTANLSDLANAATARTNLGLGSAATSNTSAFDAAGAASAVQALAALKANNLSDLANVSTARTNLGLGGLAVLSSINDGNWSGTDLSIANGGTGASTATAARTNLGLGAAALLADPIPLANGGTGSTNAAAARTALGLGTAATVATGTSGATIPLLNGANTWSASQTMSADIVLSTGGQLTITGTPATNEIGYLGTPQNSKSAAYTLTMADAGHQIYHPTADTTARTWTIPANSSVPFPIGTKIELVNDTGAGNITIAITSDTLTWCPSGSTGSRTLTNNGSAMLSKITATSWQIFGVGLS